MSNFRRFHLVRTVDVSGISGTGVVCEGVVFSTGKAVLMWLGEFKSVAVYENIQELIDIHGHNGATIVKWLD